MKKNFTTFAFSEQTRKLQERYGSRAAYARMEDGRDRFELTWKEASFLQDRDGFFMATIGKNGWPYVQFRGGPPGFIRILNERTIAFADFSGNKQHISNGNILDTKHVSLIAVDYPHRQRLKIWAEAQIVFAEDDPEFIESMHPEGYKATPERVTILTIEAFDWNCPQHIPQRYTLDEIRRSPELLTQLNET